MRQHRAKYLASALRDPVGTTVAPGQDANCASPAGPLTAPRSSIEMPQLLRRNHGPYPLPGMMFNTRSSKVAARSPN